MVVSFNKKAVLPAVVMAALGKFVVRWAATTQPLVAIIGATMTSDYIQQARPVFSGPRIGHFTLVADSRTVMGGMRAVCTYQCGGMVGSIETRRHGGMEIHRTFNCIVCKSYASCVLPRDYKVLHQGRRDIEAIPDQRYWKTAYPLPVMPLKWETGKEKEKVAMISQTDAGPSKIRSRLRRTAHPPLSATPSSRSSAAPTPTISAFSSEQSSPVIDGALSIKAAGQTNVLSVDNLTQLLQPVNLESRPKRARTHSVSRRDESGIDEGSIPALKRRKSHICKSFSICSTVLTGGQKLVSGGCRSHRLKHGGGKVRLDGPPFSIVLPSRFLTRSIRTLLHHSRRLPCCFPFSLLLPTHHVHTFRVCFISTFQ
jgi:hypothetical protein